MVAARAICVLSLSVASALAFSPSTPLLRGSSSAALSAVRHRQQPLVASGRGVGRGSAALSSLNMGFLDMIKDVSATHPLHLFVPVLAASPWPLQLKGTNSQQGTPHYITATPNACCSSLGLGAAKHHLPRIMHCIYNRMTSSNRH